MELLSLGVNTIELSSRSIVEVMPLPSNGLVETTGKTLCVFTKAINQGLPDSGEILMSLGKWSIKGVPNYRMAQSDLS